MTSSEGCHRQTAPGDEAQALARSLKSAFRLFAIFCAVSFAGYLLSGIYVVQEGSIAVHVRLGRLLNEGRAIAPGGPYWAFPSPIDQVIKVPTSFQEVTVEDTFWGYDADRKPVSLEDLSPTQYGSLITGDRNIVFAKWSAAFRVRSHEVSSFLRVAGTLEQARDLVKVLLEQAAVKLVSQTSIDEIYRGGVDVNVGRSLLQAAVDSLGAGLEITSFSMKERAVPGALESTFKAVNQSENEKAQAIERARQYRVEVLTQAVGTTYDALLAAIDAFESALSHGSSEARASAELEVRKLLTDARLGGSAAATIQSALGYKTQVTQGALAFAERYTALLPALQENPRLARQRLVAEVLERVLKGAPRSFHLPGGNGKQIYLNFGAAKPLPEAK